MLKKTIEYVDYNGVERKEDHYFHFTDAEIMEMEMSVDGGFVERINKVVSTKDSVSLIKIWKKLILDAYGEKSADGKRFIKRDTVDGHRLADDFAQTEAYSILFMELSTNAEAAAAFVNGVVPNKK